MATRSAGLNQRQTDLLALIEAHRGPLSTTEVRARANSQASTPLVAEQVYRALRSLHQRGLIERVTVPDATQVLWQITDPTKETAR